MYCSIDDVKKSEKYLYFRELGYSENEAVVLSLIDFGDNSHLNRVLKEYKKSASLSDSTVKNYFSFRVRTRYKKLPAISASVDIAEENDDSIDAMASIAVGGSANSLVSQAEFGTANEQKLNNENPFENIEDTRTDTYESIVEKESRNVTDSPTATFRPTYNTAAAGILLSNIREGSNTCHSMVRTEELLNYLHYDLNYPSAGKFEVTKELKMEGDKTYLFLGVQGEKTIPARQNICLLLDTSGSMYDKKDSMISIIATVLAKMNPGDLFSIVTYSSTDHVIINSLELDDKKNLDEILELLAGITIEGCTNGSAGLNTAYEIIEKNKIADGINRVIIVTDGDLNFGIHDKDGLIGLIEKKKETGAYFSAIGTGIYNLQDDKLEAMAKNGNGNYFVVNSISDVRKTVRDDYEALVYPIAKNVKAQIEFNPEKVKTWKLIGYENRMLNHEDFRNDKVIAEPFGSGSYFIALFELTMNNHQAVKSSLKYQKLETVGSNDIGTLTIRYEDVQDDQIKEVECVVEENLTCTGNIEKAIECAKIAEKLRQDNVDELTKRRLETILAD